jgi:hypothetical protein
MKRGFGGHVRTAANGRRDLAPHPTDHLGAALKELPSPTVPMSTSP